MATQEYIDDLIIVIETAEDAESVTNQMVAAVLDFLNVNLKKVSQGEEVLEEEAARIAADAVLQKAIDAVSLRIDRLVGNNASQAIDNFNEILDFLDGLKDSDSLAALLADINARIGTKAGSVVGEDSVWGELKKLGGIITDLGVVPLSFFDNLGFSTGIYVYRSEEDNVPGILFVDYPASNTIYCQQIRFVKGVTYNRVYNRLTGEWSDWESVHTTYKDAADKGYNGTEKSFYESLSLIDNLSFLKSVSYDNIDAIKTGGIYRVYDSDSVTHDIMFVTYSSEHGVTKQTYISTNPDFPIPGLAYRTYDGEKWSDWQEIGGDFKKSLDDEIKARKKGDDKLRDAISDHSTARFDKIVTDASVVIEGVTDVDGGQIVYVRSKQKFACFLNDKYYLGWPTSATFMSADNKVLTDKVYLCENKAYIYYAGALLPVDEGAMALAISASASANAALEKLKTINAMKSVAIDQLDNLNDPENPTSHYTVLCQDHPVGSLCCFTNSKSNIITQILDANWDIDVSGQLLPEYAGTQHKSLLRVYNYDSDELEAEIPKKTWGKWKYNQKIITLEGGIIIE